MYMKTTDKNYLLTKHHDNYMTEKQTNNKTYQKYNRKSQQVSEDINAQEGVKTELVVNNTEQISSDEVIKQRYRQYFIFEGRRCEKNRLPTSANRIVRMMIQSNISP